MQHQNGLFKAIKHCGSQQALAKAIGSSQRSISHWLNREINIPYQYAVAIFFLTKGAISLNELAPENFKINCQIEQQFYFSLKHTKNKNGQ
jgi:DNA-binding transcriptional regulator YdaS (Cro superfamily)